MGAIICSLTTSAGSLAPEEPPAPTAMTLYCRVPTGAFSSTYEVPLIPD